MQAIRAACGSLVLVLLAATSLRASEEHQQISGNIARQLLAIARDDQNLFPLKARVAAAQSLARMGLDARAVIPELIQILNSPLRTFPLAVDEALVLALGRMGALGRPAVPALVRNAGRDCDLDRAINIAVVAILRAPPVSESVAVLIKQMKSTDTGERLKAAKNLGALGFKGKAAVPALTQALADPDADVRRTALRALEAIQQRVEPTRAVLAISIRDLSDPDEAVRLRAAKELGRFGPAARSALPALLSAGKSDPDEDVRRVANEAASAIKASGDGKGEQLPVPGAD